MAELTVRNGGKKTYLLLGDRNRHSVLVHGAGLKARWNEKVSGGPGWIVPLEKGPELHAFIQENKGHWESDRKPDAVGDSVHPDDSVSRDPVSRGPEAHSSSHPSSSRGADPRNGRSRAPEPPVDDQDELDISHHDNSHDAHNDAGDYDSPPKYPARRRPDYSDSYDRQNYPVPSYYRQSESKSSNSKKTRRDDDHHYRSYRDSDSEHTSDDDHSPPPRGSHRGRKEESDDEDVVSLAKKMRDLVSRLDRLEAGDGRKKRK